MTNAEFFRELCAASGYIDEASAKRVYYGLIKLLSRELRTKQYVKMPDWGLFSIIMQASRRLMNIHTKQIHMLPIKKVIKYEADYKLKDYFKKL